MAVKISRLDLTEAHSTISIWLHDDGSLVMRVANAGGSIGVPFSVDMLSPRSQEIMIGWFGRCGHAGHLAFMSMGELATLEDRGAA